MSASAAARDSSGVAPALAAVTGSKLDGFAPELAAVGRAPAGWPSLAELTRAPGRHARLIAISAAAGPGAPAHLPVVWEVEAVAWLVGALVGGSLLASGTLVAADPSRTWARMGEDGLAEALAVDLGTRCSQTTERGGSAALVDGARRTLGALLEPLIGAATRPRSRVLWWHAGDRIADALLFCGQALDERPAALRMAAQLVEAEVPWRVPVASADGGLTRMRRTCCLSRRLEPPVTCEGCPLRR